VNPEEQARLDRAKARRVMIATPIARAPVWQYTVALAETCVLLHGLGVKFYYASVVGMSNLPRVRNILVARFLASDATDLMFIDDDIGWNQNDVLRLLASEQPLIAGVGRKKSDERRHDPGGWCCEFLPGAERGLATDPAGNVEVARVGTGFMRVRRSVFEEMIRRQPELKGTGEPKMPLEEQRLYYRFFQFGDDETTEDYMFCDRWRALGGRIFIDPSVNLSHVGETAYAGSIMELIGTTGGGST
jgi:hypothetical protein